MPIQLSEDERELLLTEVAQAMDQVRDPRLKVTYGELLTAVDLREVPDDLVPPLQMLLEIGLETGRIRKVHTAHGEMTARRIYSRTPNAQTMAVMLDEVNEALKALEGQTLDEIRIATQNPGTYLLTLGTSQGKLLLRLERHSVRIQSLEVG